MLFLLPGADPLPERVLIHVDADPVHILRPQLHRRLVHQERHHRVHQDEQVLLPHDRTRGPVDHVGVVDHIPDVGRIVIAVAEACLRKRAGNLGDLRVQRDSASVQRLLAEVLLAGRHQQDLARPGAEDLIVAVPEGIVILILSAAHEMKFRVEDIVLVRIFRSCRGAAGRG